MSHLIDLLREFGIGFVFLNVLLEQGGLPIPAVPTMVVAGALMAASHSSLVALIATAVVAALIADTFWYFTGRRIGMRVLRILCRVTLSPDSCVRQTESIFARWGASSMLENRVAAILDVRSRMAQDATGHIPGASRVDVQSLEGLPELVEDGEVVVYCACPNEESAVTVARRLRGMGFKRVRPLHGGIDAWISTGREVARIE